MQFVILGMLHGGPRSLYEIKQAFATVLSLFYSASFGSIQRALGVLVDEGRLTVADDPGSGRGRRLYTLTDDGRAAFVAWMREPITASDLEQAMLAKVFFLGVLAEPGDRAAVLDGIRARIAADRERLDVLAASLPADDGADPRLGPPLAVLDYGRRSLALAADWASALAAGSRA